MEKMNMKAAALLCIGFGSFSDPPEAQGLAHFLGSQGKPEFKTIATAMATTKIRRSSFSRNLSTTAPSLGPGLMCGPNGTVFLSSGMHDLDKVLGGGFPLESLVMVMEDAEAPHHMFLLRNFLAQGLVHGQPLLYASPARDPRRFLGTLLSLAVSKDDKSREPDPNKEKGMIIAWQYKKYFSENQLTFDGQRVTYLKNALFLISVHVIFFSKVQVFSLYVNMVQMENGHNMNYSRSGICLTTIRSLKSMHMADTLLLVKAIQDEDKKLALLLTSHQDMVGFLNVHKVARINTHVLKH
ncbi:Elongator complex protein 4 isoform 2 [Hibiscus syriacus]|uniref:Elongator complex protein 4 n=1 Tax=Hibiscus syriacus TaxID=106335 RepID=A0A6A2WWZ3_HIBSY|nr:Elongator complex protein 4 isoform 2 [Hibiscus syriacus]